jgi:1-acyl-sn-glycerol-3-phosphate acyltransferase
MSLNGNETNNKPRRAFIPAKPTDWFIRTAQAYVRAELALSNSLHLDDQDLQHIRSIPADCGVILASNHADEVDPRVCLELSRRTGRRFIFMCNREAFDEKHGLAGWVLQRLGLFSVERGAHDQEAKLYATNVVKGGKDILVIFPEGEIFYLNEKVRPFHSGVIEICLQAIVQQRQARPDWTSYIVPMGIKYHYELPIESELAKRITKMEADLSLPPGGATLQSRLLAIQRTLLKRNEVANNVALDTEKLRFTQEIVAVKEAILAEVEQRHEEMPIAQQAQTIDRAWQLSAQIRQMMREQSDSMSRERLQNDLDALKEVAQLSSWQPNYYLEGESIDRLAEGVLKVERELYKIQRPPQLARRSVLVKLAAPIEMGSFVNDYIADARDTRHRLTNRLQDEIQSLVCGLTAKSAQIN